MEARPSETVAIHFFLSTGILEIVSCNFDRVLGRKWSKTPRVSNLLKSMSYGVCDGEQLPKHFWYRKPLTEEEGPCCKYACQVYVCIQRCRGAQLTESAERLGQHPAGIITPICPEISSFSFHRIRQPWLEIFSSSDAIWLSVVQP